MGTAGHVDHGKTALVRALTGIECDTHREEKARGITINLGFAHLDLPCGDSIGIIDVPGHRDFVHTMVGGASGIDFALLVIAADSGVMPQTREHLQIMNMLGIETGLIAITRTDLAETDIVAMAEEESRDLVAGTFLEDCDVVRVSAVTDEGIDELKTRIEAVAAGVPEKPAGEVFRMFADRIFSVSGFGSVVTGSVMSGSLKVEDRAYLLPGVEKEMRVRRLERHGREVDDVVTGDRASINLVGLDRDDFKRGMIVSDRPLRATELVDGRLQLFGNSKGFRLWTQVVFHLGTYEHPARVHLMDCDSIPGGGSALVQIHLATPCVVQHGDRFVLRSSSSDTTLGGGEIIDAAPLHHRRRPEKLVRSLGEIADGELAGLVAAEARKNHGAVSGREIADNLNISMNEVKAVFSGGAPDDIVVHDSGDDIYMMVKTACERQEAEVQKRIGAHHRRHPLVPSGRSIEELGGILGVQKDSPGEVMLRHLLDGMVLKGSLKQVGRTWAMSGHTAAIDSDMKESIRIVEAYLESCGMQTPLMSELERVSEDAEIDRHKLDEILRHLVTDGKAYHADGNYIHAHVVDGCRAKLLTALAGSESGMTVADFRNLVNGNRKICLLLLGMYDSEGVTQREGDVRVITDKGRGLDV